MGNGYAYNPTRQLPTGQQGHRSINPETGSTYSPRGSINLYNLRRRNVSFGNPAFRRLLVRLNLIYKNENNTHHIYKPVPPDIWFEGDRLLKREHPPQLLYSGTNASQMVDWLVGVYVPELIRTGTVPGPTLEQQESAAHRKAREAYKARPKLTRKQAAAMASAKRW
jgi:hypothetical protein